MTDPSRALGGSPAQRLSTESFHPETLLRLEYEYARETIEQALEDRRRVVEFYILMAGGLGSLSFALAQFDANRTPSVSQLDSALGAGGHIPGIVFALIFWVIGITGFFTLLHLIRLRQAAHDSMRAMNHVKEFYLKRFPELAEALRWRSDTLPPLNRIGSITFNHALLVVLLDSLAFGSGLLFLDLKSSMPPVTLAVGAGALAFLWQALVYFWMLSDR
ncbi:MAG: hypothetical protein HYR71_09375 [Chloroflexi bacterium]|nr:hypothetical protein [Chloroflexota bacterium]